jgi:predicted permease
VLQDLRFAVRLLLKDRSFTLTALLTLILCLGANTAMFGIVRSVLMKPLPFAQSDRIVLLYNSYPNAGARRAGTAVPDYFDRLTAVPALDEQAIFQTDGVTYGDENGAERLNVLRATPSFYRLVHVQPVAGRVFTQDDGEPGKDTKVLLSYGFWQRKFGGDSSITRRQVRLSGTAYDIVGVMPREFTFLQNDTDLFLPASFTPAQKDDNQRHNNGWQMIGRLKAGATMAQVRDQVNALNANNDVRLPQYRQLLKDAGFHTVAVFLADDVVRDVKAVLYLLWGGVLFVLLIGAVNIANLVIVRASGRRRELATRHAIGADLWRLARQLLTETTLLSVMGGSLGVLLGWWALKYMAALNLDQLPRGYEIALDPTGVLFTAALTLLVGALIGVAPVLQLRRINLNAELREEGRGGTAGRRANALRRVLAMAQVALALMLLVGAGLLFASFRAVMRLDLGFQPDNVATAAVCLPATTYKDPPALVMFEQRTLAAIRALPGVEAAATTSLVPFSGNISNSVIMAEGYVMKPGESLLAPSSVNASAGYFEAMHVTLLKGRFFDARDTASQPLTVLVDDRLARKFWPDQDPIGRRMYRPTDAKDITKITPQTQFMTVVGVVKEMQIIDPRGDITPVGTLFTSYEQNAGRGLTFVVKTRAASPTIMNDIRRVVASIDPQLPVFRPRTLQQWIDFALVGRRAPMLIAMAFGGVALFLSSLGIYGVLAYGVAQRQRELGVRMALGGTASSVFGLVLGDGLKILGIGLGIGLAGSFLVGQVMKSELFNVAPMNPLVVAMMTATLSVVALVASTIPAWRASRINPIVVLGK